MYPKVSSSRPDRTVVGRRRSVLHSMLQTSPQIVLRLRNLQNHFAVVSQEDAGGDWGFGSLGRGQGA